MSDRRALARQGDWVVGERAVDVATDVAVTTPAERFGLVPEVTQDEVVPASGSVDIAQELAKERPRTLGLVRRRQPPVRAELAKPPS